MKKKRREERICWWRDRGKRELLTARQNVTADISPAASVVNIWSPAPGQLSSSISPICFSLLSVSGCV